MQVRVVSGDAGQTPDTKGTFSSVVDLFAGPGGWDTGARDLGIVTTGVEWDAAACETAKAAGHARLLPHTSSGSSSAMSACNRW